MVHPLESRTIEILKQQGYDFSAYLNPIPFLPPAMVGPVSDILDEAEDDEEVEEE